MRRFSTLMTAVAAFFTVQVNAQNYSEDFDTPLTDPGNGCIETSDMLWATKSSPSTKGFVITGNGSAYAEPPVSGATVRVFNTPYLSLSTATTISFDYQLTSKLTGGAVRFINVGTIDSLGNFSSIDSFGVDPNNTSKITKSYSLSLAGTSTRRVSIRLGGGGGDGNSRIVFDDLAVNAPWYNGGACNTAPTALPNTYYPLLATDAVSGNVINDGTGNDTDLQDGFAMTTTLLTPISPSVGTLSFNADGSFIFTPAATFSGGLVTFSYRVTDKGYPRMSATTTVSLEYPALITLPVKLTNFSGSAANNKAQLRWSVADNETGDHFQVLRSADGKNFTEACMVFINSKVGAESYTYADKTDLDAATYYKLKVVNKDKSVSYSNVIILKNATTKGAAGVSILKNPVESTVTFTYTASTATQSNVTIYNASGVKVYSNRLSSQKGINAVSLPLDSHMAAGTYILEVTNGAERMVTKLLKK